MDDGLLTRKLLVALWSRYELQDQDINVLIQLMQAFSLCSQICNQLDVYFFPWFVENNSPPNVAMPEMMHSFDQGMMSTHYHCCFLACIPDNIFQIIALGVQKLATKLGCRSERYAWRDGLLIQIDEVQWIIKRHNDKPIISFSVSGNTWNCTKVWKSTAQLYSSFENSLKPYKKIVKEDYFLCNHCLLMKKVPCCKRWPEEVLHVASSVAYLTCSGNKVPRALVAAFPGILC